MDYSLARTKFGVACYFFPIVVACECINLYQSGHVDTGLKISVFKLFGAKANAGKSAKITFLRFSPVMSVANYYLHLCACFMPPSPR